MKIHLKYIALGLVIALSGCTESKDKAYYQTHVDEAITKIANCESIKKTAMENKDTQILREIQNDEECKIAFMVRFNQPIQVMNSDNDVPMP
ncbi:MAG: hypothetical protein Q9M36_08375 [Sulfurovum sp.]|nr:hypothetical protein [Sulfurovum sp.]